MATAKEEGAVPEFLRMDQPVRSGAANAKRTGNWHGWPTKDITPITLTDDEGRTVRIRTPVMDLEGSSHPPICIIPCNILPCRRSLKLISGS
jgi:hypothetical protein